MKHTAEAELATKLSACVRACTPKEPDAHCGRSQGHHAHQLARPNFAFVPVLRRSNPGCNITILTDQATQFAGLPPGVQVFRYALDRARMGRNAWANYYQFRAQQARPARPAFRASSVVQRQHLH